MSVGFVLSCASVLLCWLVSPELSSSLDRKKHAGSWGGGGGAGASYDDDDDGSNPPQQPPPQQGGGGFGRAAGSARDPSYPHLHPLPNANYR